MNQKPMIVIAGAFAALTLMSACDKRDNAATPPMPSTTTPSTTTPSTTAPTMPSATDSASSPSGAASTPSMGASN